MSFFVTQFTAFSCGDYQRNIYRGEAKLIPPSTGIQAPVIKEAESEAKKAITEATSLIVP